MPKQNQEKEELKDEKAIIEEAKKDLSHFKVLYNRYIKAVYRYCYQRLGKNRELAEDITSETFVKAIDKFHTFKYKEKPFVVWLYTIAHNLIVDHYRSKKEKNISLDSLLIQPPDNSEEILNKLSKEELIEKINKKTSELPDEIANIFTLRHTENLSFAEIAKLVGKTEGAVKMQYYRGIKYLKKLILP